eukprot:4007431-Pleurochrysis_carterae.AAC.2
MHPSPCGLAGYVKRYPLLRILAMQGAGAAYENYMEQENDAHIGLLAGKACGLSVFRPTASRPSSLPAPSPRCPSALRGSPRLVPAMGTHDAHGESGRPSH